MCAALARLHASIAISTSIKLLETGLQVLCTIYTFFPLTLSPSSTIISPSAKCLTSQSPKGIPIRATISFANPTLDVNANTTVFFSMTLSLSLSFLFILIFCSISLYNALTCSCDSHIAIIY